MEDQKPQGGKALDSCILFPLNINTLLRQMRLQPPFPLWLIQRQQFTKLEVKKFLCYKTFGTEASFICIRFIIADNVFVFPYLGIASEEIRLFYEMLKISVFTLNHLKNDDPKKHIIFGLIK